MTETALRFRNQAHRTMNFLQIGRSSMARLTAIIFRFCGDFIPSAFPPLITDERITS